MVHKKTANLGKGIARSKNKLRAKLNEAWAVGRAADAAASAPGEFSMLEQSNMDELIATVELRKTAYLEQMGEAEFVYEGPTLVEPATTRKAEQNASRRREIVSIPRRPAWHEGMSPDELAAAETATFLEWRRSIALESQAEGLLLTPYERNLDFWRQLWRCCERSDLLVEIVDARDPHFYHSRDLGRYVGELDGAKKLALLVNKADYLTADQRCQWADYYQKCGVDVLFFSALREVKRHAKDDLLNVIPRIRREAQGDLEAVNVDEVDEERAEVRQAEAVFARARREAEENDEAEPSGEAGPSAEVVGGVDVPVPDSDDELDAPGELGGASAPSGRGESTDDEEEGPGALGELADDDEGVLDSSRLLEELCSRLPHGDAGGAASSWASTEGTRARLGTIGFVGYPNVGKSTVINALLGTKRVGMSKRPGKTRHIQTLEVPHLGVTLCDCPGLVFPSVAATKAHLVISNTVPLDDLRECWSSVALILEKIGWQKALEHYDVTEAHVVAARERSGDHVLDDTHAFLAAFAVSRKHHLRHWVPDENWAARKVLADYVSGRLLHCEPPPLEEGEAGSAAEEAAAAAAPPRAEAAAAAPAEPRLAPAPESAPGGSAEEEDDDFGDVGGFIEESRGEKVRGMTKRKERAMNKQLLRGKTPATDHVHPRQHHGTPASVDMVKARGAAPHGAGGWAGVR